MVTDLEDREFAEMLAAIWERHGWSTDVTTQAETVMVAGDRPDGRRGAILVASGSGVVGEAPVQQLQELKAEKGIDVAVAATNESFSQDARDLAGRESIHLLDPETLAETAEAQGFEDLLEQYSGGGSSAGLGSILPSGLLGAVQSGSSAPFKALSSLSSLVPGRSTLGSVINLFTGGSGSRALVAVVGIVGVLLLGNVFGFGVFGGGLGGLPIPDFGILDAIGGVLGALPLPELGLGGGGYSVTAVSLVDADAEPVAIEWDAKQTSEVVGPNGTRYESPENYTFVVVQLNASNPTAETVLLEPSTFGYATGKKRYGPQPLDGAQGQLPVVVPPLSYNRGYVVFSVPEEADSGTLLALPGPEATPIDFERNRGLEYQIQG